MRNALLVCGLVSLWPTLVLGQDRVLLQEVLPALAGTELGLLEVGEAPPAGTSRRVRRSEVLRALRREGRSVRGLAIPRSVRVTRKARDLDAGRLESLARPALAEAFHPCQVGDIATPARLTVPAGPLTARATAEVPRRDGRFSAILILEAQAHEQRVPVRAALRCPPPSVKPGDRVRIQVVINNVRASAPGQARQAGRVGDVIRVGQAHGRGSVLATVVDGRTVELIR